MESSPQGREIEDVEGAASAIISRGEDITRLGAQMRRSAEILDGIKNNSLESGGQVGKAIEELSEKIGDSYETLYKAADLYEPVGPVITAYGEELDSVQPLIKSAVTDSEDLWAAYEALPGSVEPRGTGGFLQPEAGSPEADAQGDEDRAKKAAYEAWEERAQDFDAHYDTWEGAFKTAVSGVTDGMADGIEDGFWDHFDATVAFLKNVVDIAALVVGIIALFAGGWVLALAAVLALAVLALTSIQALRGDASGWDVVFAALGVVPVGKITFLTKLAAVRKLGGEGAAMKNVLKSGPLKKFVDLKILKPVNPVHEVNPTFMNRLGFQKFEDVMKGYENALGHTIDRATARQLYKLAQFERDVNNAGALAGHYGRVQTFANHDWNPLTPDVYKPPSAVGNAMKVAL